MKKSLFNFLQYSMFIAVMGCSLSAFGEVQPVNSKEAKLEIKHIDASYIQYDQCGQCGK